MRGKTAYGGLDLFRFLAAFLVAAIHTSPLGSFSAEGDFFLTRILARVAVPFFFLVTGQFLLGKLSEPGEQWQGSSRPTRRGNAGKQWQGSSRPAGRGSFAPIRKYLLKIALLYGISILLYLPIGLYARHYQEIGPLDALRLLVFDGTFYHLWYFPACMLGVLLVWLLSRRLSLKTVTGIAAALYLVGLLGDSYYGLTARVPLLSGIYAGFFHVFSYTRNGLFFAPLFLVMGVWMYRLSGNLGTAEEKAAGTTAAGPGHRLETASDTAARSLGAKARRRPLVLGAGFLLSLALMTAEAFTLRHFQLQRHDSMYLFLAPCMYFLYRLLLCWNAKPRPKLRTLSTWIYILHPAMIVVIRGGAGVLGLEEFLVDNSLVHYAAVCLASLLAALCVTVLLTYFESKKRPAGSTTVRSPRRPLFASLPGIVRKPSPTGRAWIELDREALRENVRALRAALPAGCKLMPALKANAYGHGAVLMARELSVLGIHDYCVAALSEGIALRKSGIRGNILILGYTHPRDFGLLRRYRLTQTVLDSGYAARLNRYGKKLAVHIGIDTGMHRLGIDCENMDELRRIYRMKHLRVKGLFSHLCASDGTSRQERDFTLAQAQAFYRTVERLRQEGFPCPGLHLLASYGIRNYPQYAGDYARVGIALYGVLSTREDDTGQQGADVASLTAERRSNSTASLAAERQGAGASSLALRPVLSLKARVATVKDLSPGETAGYGLAFTARRPTKLAVLSIGYADGLPRALSCGRGQVLINGHRAPIAGRICMDQTLVDVTDIPFVCPGAEAVLIGVSGQEEITAYDLAEACGTITNEILSRLGERLGRMVC